MDLEQVLTQSGQAQCHLEKFNLDDHFFFFMAKATQSHASTAYLWSLSTLFCPASSVLPLVM